MGFYVAMKDYGYMTWPNANQNYSFCGDVKGGLPTLDQLKTLYNNKSRVNALLSTNGGTRLTNNYYWSFIDYTKGRVYLVNMSSGNYHSHYAQTSTTGYVRPVLTSY